MASNDQPAATPLLRLPYKVMRHEQVSDALALVALKCIGYPTDGAQPVEWEFVVRVPKAELSKWPLGRHVSLMVTA
jgi:hypothetical protein